MEIIYKYWCAPNGVAPISIVKHMPLRIYMNYPDINKKDEILKSLLSIQVLGGNSRELDANNKPVRYVETLGNFIDNSKLESFLNENLYDSEEQAVVNCCPVCESNNTIEEITIDNIPYGIGDEQKIIPAQVPMFTCSDCGFVWTDFRAEKLRKDAIDKYLAEGKNV